METLFDGDMWVAYGQFYLTAGGDNLEAMEAAFAGQSNGLCGAAAAGSLFFMTGLHTGSVPLKVTSFDSRPETAADWEDVVEVSLLVEAAPVWLLAWAGEQSIELAIDPGRYRVRYCASGMDVGREADTRLEDDEELDRYLVQLWPEAPSEDAVMRQASAAAAYWHEYARGLRKPAEPSLRGVTRTVVQRQPLETVPAATRAAPGPSDDPASSEERPKAREVRAGGATAETRAQSVVKRTAVARTTWVASEWSGAGSVEDLPVGPLPRAGYVSGDASLVVDRGGHAEVVEGWREAHLWASYETAVGTLLWGNGMGYVGGLNTLVAPGRRDRIGSAPCEMSFTISTDGAKAAVVESKTLRRGSWWRPFVVDLTDGTVTPLAWAEHDQIAVTSLDKGVLYIWADRANETGRPGELLRWPLGGNPEPIEGPSGPLHGSFPQRDPASGCLLVDDQSGQGLWVVEAEGTQRPVDPDPRARRLTPGGEDLYWFSYGGAIHLQSTRDGTVREIPLSSQARTDEVGPLRPIWEDAHHLVLIIDNHPNVGAVRVDTSTGEVEAIHLIPDPGYRPCLVEPLPVSGS